MGITISFGGGRRHRNEIQVKTPKGKCIFSICAALFLTLMLSILTLAFVFFIGEYSDSKGYVYEYEEVVAPSQITYEITVECKADQKAPDKFRVKFEMLDLDRDPIHKEASAYETETDDGKKVFGFNIVLSQTEWAGVSSLSAVYLYFGEECITATPHESNNMIIGCVVIGIFLVVITGLIVFNIVSAVKYGKQARAEARGETVGFSDDIFNRGSSRLSNNNQSQVRQEKVKCPYCGSYNSNQRSTCENCKGPLM